MFFSKNIFSSNKSFSYIYLNRNANTSYNTDDFLLEIEHLNIQINNREKQMQSDTFKVCRIDLSEEKNLKFSSFSILS